MRAGAAGGHGLVLLAMLLDEGAQFPAEHDELLFSEGLVGLDSLIDGLHDLLVEERVGREVNAVLCPELVDQQARYLLALVLTATHAA